MDESVVREGEFRVCATLRRRAPEVSSADQVFGTRCEVTKLVVAGSGRVGLKTRGGTCFGLRAILF
jgi:Lon protease-like protein